MLKNDLFSFLLSKYLLNFTKNDLRKRNKLFLPRINISIAGLDFEDFIYNRTDGSPQDIFRKLGTAATSYITTLDQVSRRSSNIPELLEPDHIEHIENLTLPIIKQLTSASIFYKAKRFEVKRSTVISTRVYRDRHCINGSYRAVRIYKQQITWAGENDSHKPFSLTTLNLYCDCKFFRKETQNNGRCCRHITGQLRRIVFLSTIIQQLCLLPRSQCSFLFNHTVYLLTFSIFYTCSFMITKDLRSILLLLEYFVRHVKLFNL